MKRVALISVIVGAAFAIVPAALAAEVSDGGGPKPDKVQFVTMAPTSYQDALQTYGSPTSTVTSVTQLDPAIQAVLLRNQTTQSVPVTGKALADFYDTGAVVTSKPSVSDTGAFVGRPDILGGNGTAPTTSSDSTSVDWSAVIPAIALGVLLIAMTATFVTRRRQHQLSV